RRRRPGVIAAQWKRARDGEPRQKWVALQHAEPLLRVRRHQFDAGDRLAECGITHIVFGEDAPAALRRGAAYGEQWCYAGRVALLEWRVAAERVAARHYCRALHSDCWEHIRHLRTPVQRLLGRGGLR